MTCWKLVLGECTLSVYLFVKPFCIWFPWLVYSENKIKMSIISIYSMTFLCYNYYTNNAKHNNKHPNLFGYCYTRSFAYQELSKEGYWSIRRYTHTHNTPPTPTHTHTHSYIQLMQHCTTQQNAHPPQHMCTSP